MRSRIVLIRHGITTGNVRRLYYGSTDVPLAEEGIAELKRLAADGIYPDSDNAKFYTSGMLRTKQTLDLIYTGRSYEVIEDLQELDFGIFEMKSYEQLEGNPVFEAWINSGDKSQAPPGGESILHFNSRIKRGFDTLMTKHAGDVRMFAKENKEAMSICICHGGAISGILNDIWPDRYEYFYSWIPDPGHGYVLTLDDENITGEEKF